MSGNSGVFQDAMRMLATSLGAPRRESRTRELEARLHDRGGGFDSRYRDRDRSCLSGRNMGRARDRVQERRQYRSRSRSPPQSMGYTTGYGPPPPQAPSFAPQTSAQPTWSGALPLPPYAFPHYAQGASFPMHAMPPPSFLSYPPYVPHPYTQQAFPHQPQQQHQLRQQQHQTLDVLVPFADEAAALLRILNGLTFAVVSNVNMQGAQTGTGRLSSFWGFATAISGTHTGFTLHFSKGHRVSGLGLCIGPVTVVDAPLGTSDPSARPKAQQVIVGTAARDARELMWDGGGGGGGSSGFGGGGSGVATAVQSSAAPRARAMNPVLNQWCSNALPLLRLWRMLRGEEWQDSAALRQGAGVPWRRPPTAADMMRDLQQPACDEARAFMAEGMMRDQVRAAGIGAFTAQAAEQHAAEIQPHRHSIALLARLLLLRDVQVLADLRSKELGQEPAFTLAPSLTLDRPVLQFIREVRLTLDGVEALAAFEEVCPPAPDVAPITATDVPKSPAFDAGAPEPFEYSAAFVPPVMSGQGAAPFVQHTAFPEFLAQLRTSVAAAVGGGGEARSDVEYNPTSPGYSTFASGSAAHVGSGGATPQFVDDPITNTFVPRAVPQAAPQAVPPASSLYDPAAPDGRAGGGGAASPEYNPAACEELMMAPDTWREYDPATDPLR